MGAIAKAQQEKQVAKRSDSFESVLKHAWPRMASVMPKHMSSERMYQLALSTYNQTPGLAECSPQSVLGCLMKCTALGLEPSAVDGLGRAYILPYYNKKTNHKEAQLIIGYRGYIDLARRSGQIVDISARAVHQGDLFEYEFGMSEYIRHVPSPEYDGTQPLTHVYMVAHFKDGGHYIDVMTRNEVDAIRKRSKVPVSPGERRGTGRRDQRRADTDRERLGVGSDVRVHGRPVRPAGSSQRGPRDRGDQGGIQ